MSDRFYNPFQAIDLQVPVDQHELYSRYCQSGGSVSLDESPFPRMVDLWFLAVCIAVRKKLEPVDVSSAQTKKIIDGSIFGNDPWRIHSLMLIAIHVSKDKKIVMDARKMMAIASGLAVAGLPLVEEMIKDGDAEPIWNLSDGIERVMRTRVA